MEEVCSNDMMMMVNTDDNKRVKSDTRSVNLRKRNTGLCKRMTRSNMNVSQMLIQEEERISLEIERQTGNDDQEIRKIGRNETIGRVLETLTNNHCNDYGGIMIDATVSGVPLKLHSVRVIDEITSIHKGHRIYRIHPIRSSLGVNMKMNDVKDYVYVWEVICVFSVGTTHITASHEAIIVVRGNGEILNFITYDHHKIPRIITPVPLEHKILSYKGHDLPDFMLVADINHQCSHICGKRDCKSRTMRTMYDSIIDGYIYDICNRIAQGINEKNALFITSVELGIILGEKGYNNGPCFFTHVMLMSDNTFDDNDDVVVVVGGTEYMSDRDGYCNEERLKYVRLLGNIVGKANKNQTYFCDPSLSTHCFVTIDTEDYKNVFPLRIDLSAVQIGNNGFVTSGDLQDLIVYSHNIDNSSMFKQVKDNLPKRRCIVSEYEQDQVV